MINLFIDPNARGFDNFKRYIRQINIAFSFASLGAKYIGNASKYMPNTKAPYCLRIDGQIYHNIAVNLNGT